MATASEEPELASLPFGLEWLAAGLLTQGGRGGTRPAPSGSRFLMYTLLIETACEGAI